MSIAPSRLQSLFEGMFALSNSFASQNREEGILSAHRLVLVNFKRDNFFINANNKIYSSQLGRFVDDQKELLGSFRNVLTEELGGQDIELLHVDKLTRSVTVVTQKYVDDLLSGKEYMGDLMLNYHKIWYMAKSGGDPNGIEKHHNAFNTFSKREVDMIKHSYIPVTVSPSEIKPIKEMTELVMESSGLLPYMEITNAYDVRAKELSGSKTYWIPRLIAREYLGEQSNYAVTSEKLFYSIIKNAGLLDTPAVNLDEDFLKSLSQEDRAHVETSQFLMREHEKRIDELRMQTTPVEQINKIIAISSDIRANDSIVKTEEPIELGY